MSRGFRAAQRPVDAALYAAYVDGIHPALVASGRALVRASALARDPGASPVTLRRVLFLRFYGHEFDARTRDRILAWLGEEETCEDRCG
jgi:hypothetical protein